MKAPMAQTTEQLQQALSLLQENTASLWPDFTPARTPFLVFDGQDSWLLHSDPPSPDGWQRQVGNWSFPGRHPQLQANTAILLDDLLPVATILLSDLPDGLSTRHLTAFAVHEAFHVYQGQHPSSAWNADEFSALTYPVGDEQVLIARAMETHALHRALHAEQAWQDWARVALGWREQRFERLSAAHQAYERALEQVEGLAHHVELRVLNELPRLTQPDMSAEQVRQRTYTVGATYAAFLDRLSFDWQTEVQERGTALDTLVAARVGIEPELMAVPDAIRLWAKEEAIQVQQRQAAALTAFETRSGQRLTLTVTDGAEPFWPRGFDPLNIRVLADGSLLHGRFLQFGNSLVQGEVLGSMCRTWGAGPHPFNSGFRQIELADVERVVEATGIQISGAGVSVQGPQGGLEHKAGKWHCEIS